MRQQTDKRPERQTDRHTSLETDIQTYVLRDRQTDRRPERKTNSCRNFYKQTFKLIKNKNIDLVYSYICKLLAIIRRHAIKT